MREEESTICERGIGRVNRLLKKEGMKGQVDMVSHVIKGQADREAQDKGIGCQRNNGRVNYLRGREE